MSKATEKKVNKVTETPIKKPEVEKPVTTVNILPVIPKVDMDKVVEDKKQTTFNLKKIEGLELENIKNQVLKGYYNRFFNNNSDSNGSEFIMGGVKQEPLLKGVKINVIPNRTYELRHCDKDFIDEELIFDIYVYKLECSSLSFFPSVNSPEVTTLQKKLDNPFLYQILLLDSHSKVELSNELRSPYPHSSIKHTLTGGQGTLTVINSQLKNIWFIDNNLVKGQDLNDVRLFKSTLYNSQMNAVKMSTVSVQNSILFNTNVYGSDTVSSDNRIKDSFIANTGFYCKLISINNAKLSDFSVSGENCYITNSRFTNINLRSKSGIKINNTVFHSEGMKYFTTVESIQLNNIYDICYFEVKSSWGFYLIRGEKSFWLSNSDNEDEINEPFEVKSTGPLFSRRHPCDSFDSGEYNHDSLQNYITRRIENAIGKSKLTSQITSYFTRIISDRIEIANSLHSMKAMTKVGYSYWS